MIDICCMNVGLICVKLFLWILGDFWVFQQGEYWNKFIEDVKECDWYIIGNILVMLDSCGLQLLVVVFKQLGVFFFVLFCLCLIEDVEMFDVFFFNVEMFDVFLVNLLYCCLSGFCDDMLFIIQLMVGLIGKKWVCDSNDDGCLFKKVNIDME